MFSESWGSPLIVEGKVYIGDADGDVTVFQVGKTKKMLSEVNVGNAVLYIARRGQQCAVHRQSVDALRHQPGRKVAQFRKSRAGLPD